MWLSEVKGHWSWKRPPAFLLFVTDSKSVEIFRFRLDLRVFTKYNIILYHHTVTFYIRYFLFTNCFHLCAYVLITYHYAYTLSTFLFTYCLFVCNVNHKFVHYVLLYFIFVDILALYFTFPLLFLLVSHFAFTYMRFFLYIQYIYIFNLHCWTEPEI